MAVVSTIRKENQEDQLYLEVKYRKLWFRLCNPNGKISKKLLSANENMAIIEARVYRDCNDPEENYIGSGFSQKFRTDDANFGLSFWKVRKLQRLDGHLRKLDMESSS